MLTEKLKAENERLIIELENAQKSLNIGKFMQILRCFSVTTLNSNVNSILNSEKEKLTVISNKPQVESSKAEDSGVLGEDEYSSDSPTDSPKKTKGQKLVKGKIIKNIKDSKDEKTAQAEPAPKVKARGQPTAI